jgi:hypothetical protein
MTPGQFVNNYFSVFLKQVHFPLDLPPEKEKALNLALNEIGGDWGEDKLTPKV